ncbi:MAG: histidine phosphatase family protein [Bacteroidota bacterium]|nr:histidine phosphatase family protein [Bacteroidota bacterium]
MITKQDVRTLYLVRHAKALKGGPAIADIDRPLHDIGILEAYEMANELLQLEEVPKLIISSTASRAICTALIFQRVLNISPENLRVTERLYEIDVRDLFEMIAELDDTYPSIMLVGHNPSFTLFSAKLDAEITHIPTGGVVRFDFDAGKWSHSSYINAQKKMLIYP